MNSMDNQNPTTQYHEQLKKEVLKSIESISQQVFILWLKSHEPQRAINKGKYQ